MATFTIQALANRRAVIEGTDKNNVSGQQIVDTTQWDGLNQEASVRKEQEAYDKQVKKFYAPVTKAADKLAKAKASVNEPDPLTYVQVQEAVKGTDTVQEIRVNLNNDSVLLRTVQEGLFDRLIWVQGELCLTV